MTHEALQADYPNKQGNPVSLVNPEQQFDSGSVQIHSEKPFIGPIDATDISRNYIIGRVKSLTEIVIGTVVENPGKTPIGLRMIAEHYPVIESEVRDAVSHGTLRLGAEYPHLTADGQIRRFIDDEIITHLPEASESYREFSDARVAIELQKSQSTQVEASFDDELERRRHAEVALKLKIRNMLVENNVSDIILTEYDHITNIETALQAEAYELEQSDTGKFWKIVLHTASTALKSIGIRPTRSTEISVVKQTNKPA